ncbi:hypothetical protein [Rhizohabitans arisaemae]|uniref:hypothetical protein n=1 Tax=Rhizohabitans arisaemae TaxID=2720610 RepID=UPI0024B2407A|nr:hypothetical protein [Rhizohabitans arisaemae]
MSDSGDVHGRPSIGAARELADAQGAVVFADTKAALMLAFTGVGLGGVGAVASSGRLAGVALAGAGMVALLLAVAAVLLLWVVRPRLPRDAGGWVGLARGLPYEGDVEADARRVARIALSKHVLNRWAVDVLVLALMAAVVTAVVVYRAG